MDGFLSCELGRLLTASFRGFCRLFSDFDISMLLIDDSIASSTMMEFVSSTLEGSPVMIYLEPGLNLD